MTNLKVSENTISAENELLIVKLADITIITERFQFENREMKLNIEQLTMENEELKKVVVDLEVTDWALCIKL
jgi:hypothetical protein